MSFFTDRPWAEDLARFLGRGTAGRS